MEKQTKLTKVKLEENELQTFNDIKNVLEKRGNDEFSYNDYISSLNKKITKKVIDSIILENTPIEFLLKEATKDEQAKNKIKKMLLGKFSKKSKKNLKSTEEKKIFTTRSPLEGGGENQI